MLIDAFLPEGITQLAVDSIFMMPQLGVLANIDKEDLKEDARKAAVEVFEKDCLIRLGTCISPVGKIKPNMTVLTAEFVLPDGKSEHCIVKAGELLRIKVPYEPLKATLTPGRGLDLGAGKGEPIETTVFGGVVGLLLDGRGRPFMLPESKTERISSLQKWSTATNEYPNIHPG
jgi:hypothetical protein